MAWSDDQRQALDLTQHIALVANAGSGKTSVLTERFATIIRNGMAPLEHVVAITFTKKAAAEMRSRVHDALAVSSDAGAREAYRRIAQARISTFHSFCGTLLRQYPKESGVAVDARELSPREAAILRATALREGMSHALAAGNAVQADLLTAFDELGVATVEKTVRQMMTSRETMEQRAAWWHGNTLEGHAQQRLETARAYVYDRAAGICRRIVDDLSSVADVNRDLITSATELLDNLINHRSERAPLEALLTLHESLYTKAGTAKKRGLVQPALKALPNLDTSFDTLRSLCLEPCLQTEELGLRIAGAMVVAAQHCAERYAALRSENNVIDFDDMLIGVRNLLRDNVGVAADVRQSMRYLMVDEFQDTNPLQYDIVRLLAPELHPNYSGGLMEHHPNVFIVGDPKQSIYGFRAADVRLFRQAQADVARANARRGAPYDGIVTLRASYRMHAWLAGFVDRWCEGFFVNESEFDVDYEHLVAGRASPEGFDGSVHVVATDVTKTDDNSDDDDTKLDVECAHVALRLCQWLRKSEGLTVCDRSGAIRQASAGDVAILARSSKGVEAMAGALRTAGIPFQIHGGRAFFSRPEVDDVRNLLRFCTDQADDVALAATLRSPFIRCSHESLVLAGAMRPRGATLWDGMVAAAALDDAPPDVATALAMLREAIADVQTLPLTIAVRRMMDRGPWYEHVGASPRCRQMMANVEKVLTMLRDELRQGGTFRDAVEALTLPEDGGNGGDADATFETDPHSVQIMTMHAAKGLQFPIVVVMELDSRDPSNGAVTWTDTYGMTANLATATVLAADPLQSVFRTESVANTMNNRLVAQAGKAEDRRLLYVALTRAQDHLVISQTFSVKKTDASLNSPGSLAKHLRPMLFQEPLQESTAVPTTLTIRQLQSNSVEEVSTVRGLHLHHANRATDFAAQPFERRESNSTVVDISASLMDHAMPDMLSVTELLDPTALADEPSARTVTDDIAEAAGTAYGTLVHYLLQHALAANANPDDPATQTMLAQMVAKRAIERSVARLAVTETLAVLQSEQLATMQRAWQQASYETARTAAHTNTVLFGVMDVVATQTDGSMHVVDWKTNRLIDAQAVEHLAATYAPQLEAYAWLTLHAHPDIDRVTTTLFFTHPLLSGKGALLHSQEFLRPNLDVLRSSLELRIAAMLERRLRRLRA